MMKPVVIVPITPASHAKEDLKEFLRTANPPTFSAVPSSNGRVCHQKVSCQELCFASLASRSVSPGIGRPAPPASCFPDYLDVSPGSFSAQPNHGLYPACPVSNLNVLPFSQVGWATLV